MNSLLERKKRILLEYNQVVREISELNSKIGFLETSKFYVRLAESAVFAMIPWMITTFTLPKIVTWGFLAPQLINPLGIGIPVLIGTLIHKKKRKKSKNEETLSSFCSAKTEAEKVEEQVRLVILKQKLKKKKVILEEELEKIAEKENCIKSLSDEYDIVLKNEENISLEELNKKVKELKSNLQEEEPKVDILNTQAVLRDEFFDVRCKQQRILDMVVSSGIPSIVFTLLYNLPSAMLETGLHIEAPWELASIIASLIFGASAGALGMLIKHKIDKQVFQKLNAELGEDAIPEIEDFSRDYKKEFEKQLVETYEIRKEYEECLDTVSQKVYGEIPIVEEIKLSQTELLDNSLVCTSREPEIYVEDVVIIESEKEDKGPTLVKRMNTNN